MNEIIAKLYDQAIVIEDGGDYICGELDPVKFAELIVQECIKVVDVWCDEVPCSEGYDKFTVSKLKERFGVSDERTN